MIGGFIHGEHLMALDSGMVGFGILMSLRVHDMRAAQRDGVWV